jgi:hypothetical protein
MFRRCGLQWLYRYGEGIKTPPGVALIVGSGTHEAIDADLSSKLKTGELLPAEAVADAARDATSKRWDEDQPVADEDALDRGQAIDQAVLLASAYHEDTAPSITPVHVERPFVLTAPGLEISGRIDVQTAHAVHDTKTAAKAPGKSDIRTPQLALYSAAVKALDGVSLDTVRLDVITKTKVPRVVSVEAHVNDADRAASLALAGSAAQGIEAGIFAPADPTSWVCTPKFCGYWERCPHGARNVAAVALSFTASVSPEEAAWTE